MLKGVTKTIKNETKEQKGRFLSILLGTLGASLLGNLLAVKGILRAGLGEKKEKEFKIWLWKTMGFLMPPHPLTSFEIQKYYQNEPRFNDVFSRNNLHKKTKDRTYIINFDEYANLGTHWISLFVTSV